MHLSKFLRRPIGAYVGDSIERARNVLGVRPDATHETIKSAFRTKAMEWHPDRNPSRDTSAEFQDCRWAFELLMDSEPGRAILTFHRVRRLEWAPIPFSS
eukprot:5499333-Amphidinium_carterae.1